MTSVTTQALASGVDALFLSHERALFGLAYRMTGCAADADEIVQEAFLALWRNPDGYDQQRG